MLKMATYTKDDLVKEFNTDKMCNITRSLTTMGYEFETNGKRGKNYRLTITKLPNMFKVFCISELGIPAQCDFDTMLYFFYFYFCDDEFTCMTSEEKQTQELNSFRNIPDSFKKIVIVNGTKKPWRNDEGFVIMGMKYFLLNADSLEF